MRKKANNTQRGFTAVELSVVCLLIAVILAIATPKITKGMRQYRLNIAMRQMADLIHKARVEAVAENRTASLVVDTTNRKFGLIIYDANNAVVRTDYVPLPQGVTFSRPTSVTPPMTNAPTSANVSFPAQGSSTTVFQQNFTSRGFLQVSTPGTINAVYFGDGTDYRSITITSVGGIRTWIWDTSSWKSTKF
jgi:prepilin-type N-terminal cleavage/methylation domain-containing protein